MFSALNNGKVSRQIKEMEDVLTSCIFDAIRFTDELDSQDFSFIHQFLSASKRFSGDFALPHKDSIKSVGYDFWPQLPDRCEPDLLITITTADAIYLVAVEAKFKSGKSSEEDRPGRGRDQLAWEWENLEQYARGRCGSIQGGKCQCEFLLIYLTGHYGMPKEEMEQSRSDARSTATSVPNWNWLSWQTFHAIFSRASTPIIREACDLLNRLDLGSFDKFHALGVAKPRWSYGWHFSIDNTHMGWEFNDGR